jgi:hypothetical protein
VCLGWCSFAGCGPCRCGRGFLCRRLGGSRYHLVEVWVRWMLFRRVWEASSPLPSFSLWLGFPGKRRSLQRFDFGFSGLAGIRCLFLRSECSGSSYGCCLRLGLEGFQWFRLLSEKDRRQGSHCLRV